MTTRSFGGAAIRAATTITFIAALMLVPQSAGAQQFFSYPPPAPDANPPAHVVVHPVVVGTPYRVVTPYMFLDGGGNPRMHVWFTKADVSGPLTVTLTAGVENAGVFSVPATVTMTTQVFMTSPGDPPTLLATFDTTQPLSSPPAASNSATIDAVAGTTYRINVSSPGQVPGPPVPFGTYRLKVDGAAELEYSNAPSSVAPFSSSEGGTRWVMNVAPGEDLNFAIVGGGPCPPQPGPIGSSSRTAGGSGYAIGDTGTINGGNNDALYVVDSVTGVGSVLTYHLTAAGTGYDTLHNSLTTSSATGTGTGFRVNITNTTGACPVLGTEVSVFDPNHQLQSIFMAPAPVSGGNFTIPQAGNTPGPWAVVVEQPFVQGASNSPYRLQKGTFVNPSNTSSAIVANSAGNDPGVYAAWLTDGKGPININIYSPPAVTSVDATLSRDLYTGRGDFGTTGSQTQSLPTNTTITAENGNGGDTGQYHLAITPPPGYIADPEQIDMPVTPDALTTAEIHIYSLPNCTAATAGPAAVWPPNHKLVPIAVDGVTNADGNPISLSITGIYQDEPTNGLGDGDTPIDGVGVGASQAQVRAERSGTGDGRAYYIGFTAAAIGGSCSGTVTVGVPHDKNGPAVGGGPLYDSTN